MNASLQRLRIRVSGRVQGVGFRPTVYRLAAGLGVSGFVRNTPGGVLIEAQGVPAALARLRARLRDRPPRHACIERVSVEAAPLVPDETGFAVITSARSGDPGCGLPPDLALCPECRAELNDPSDRRYGHLFINCTNCGPRFTILRGLPYDRARTAMARFALCAECRREFEDPDDRRFEAQPIACTACGPRVWLAGPGPAVERPPVRRGEGPPSARRRRAEQEAVLAEAVRQLNAGRILAVKGLGGYHLACAAADDAAVARLRARKRRPHKPLAVMTADLAEARRCARISPAEAAALSSPAAPIVILRRRSGAPLSSLIAPDTGEVGLFLAYTPLHVRLAAAAGPLVMTSGNRADEPMARDETELAGILGPVADAALAHDRPIVWRCDDSVLRIVARQPLPLRRSRGYVPDGIRLPFGGPPVLACGGQLKNTLCVTRGAQAVLSPHIGDLDEPRARRAFEEAAADLGRLLCVAPAALAHDLHPEYASTRYARRRGLPAVAVQHHHAHIAACMAEHGLDGQVLGVALDGTGAGPDGVVWGGEFLVAGYGAYERAGHFKAYRMPGGEAAIREPARMAFSVIHAEWPGPDGAALAAELLPGLPAAARRVLAGLLEEPFNAPWTTSAGRLFDAAAALVLGFRGPVSYEARAAIRLEALASPRAAPAWPVSFEPGPDGFQVCFGPAFRALAGGLRAGSDRAILARQFHETVAAAVAGACLRMRSGTGLDRVALSGGVFQNALLARLVTKQLIRLGFKVYSHRRVPPNDGGLALGQAAVALRRLAEGRKPACSG